MVWVEYRILVEVGIPQTKVVSTREDITIGTLVGHKIFAQQSVSPTLGFIGQTQATQNREY
jgi:hypothetical protein